MKPEIYFEDFKVGDVIELEGPELGEDEIIEFAKRYDPQPMHIDPAAPTIYGGGIIASGWQTAAYCMRLICDAYLTRAASLGSPGMEKIRWHKPVRPGDALRLRMTVKRTRASRSKPDRGVVLHDWEVFNRTNELVMTMRGYGMFLRRSTP